LDCKNDYIEKKKPNLTDSTNSLQNNNLIDLDNNNLTAGLKDSTAFDLIKKKLTSDKYGVVNGITDSYSDYLERGGGVVVKKGLFPCLTDFTKNRNNITLEDWCHSEIENPIWVYTDLLNKPSGELWQHLYRKNYGVYDPYMYMRISPNYY